MTARWHVADVAAATGAEIQQLGESPSFAGISTDSRTLRTGELFVALRGMRHDGHGFVPRALAAGAGGVLVVAPDGAPPGVTVLHVPDTMRALGDLAAWHRRRTAVRVVAITGSNGKTTTKEMLLAVLLAAALPGGVLRTRGTENNLVGVPLTLLRLGTERVAIVELGMNARGEIWRLAEIADPDVAVVTNVGPAHLGRLGSPARVAAAKGELVDRLRAEAVLVVNGDDPHVAGMAGGFVGPQVWFGAGREVAAEEVVNLGAGGTAFVLHLDGERVPVRLRALGRHNVANALAAAAAARALGVSAEAVARGLRTFQPVSMRLELRPLPAGMVLLNDAYNANPASADAALGALKGLGGGRLVAVLGDMWELGEFADPAHTEVGAAAARAGVAELVAVGRHAGALAAGASAAGLEADRVTTVSTAEEALEVLRDRLRPGDRILIKGSRGMALERVAAGLEVLAMALGTAR